MHPPHPAVVAAGAPPVPAAAGAAATAGRPAGFRWQPVTRVQLGVAAAAAALALFASTFRPADFPYLPAQCVTTAAELMELRYHAGLLLRSAIAQAGAAAAAHVIAPPSRLGEFLAVIASLLGLDMLPHLAVVVSRVLAATGGSCFTGRFRTVEYMFHFILADTFVFITPLVWFFAFFGQ